MKLLKEFKKSEFVIYAIALMLVAAGYFSYTTNLEEDTIETSYIEDAENLVEEDVETIGDAVLVNSNDVTEDNNTSKDTESEGANDIEENKIVENVSEDASEDLTKEDNTENEINEDSKEDLGENLDENIQETEESQTTSADVEETNSNIDNEDYFVSSKLERDTNYASMISTYTAILENDNVSETQKSIAMEEISKINDTKSAIMVCENLISTKGFNNCVVFVNDKSVNVVVEKDGGLTTESVAQIQNIVSRELNVELNDIHIAEK